MLLIIGSLMVFGNSMWKSLRISSSFIFLFFLPGFTWSWVFFEPKKVTTLVRIAFSVVLSVGLVPTSIILAYTVKIKVTAISTITVTALLIIAGACLRIFMHRGEHASKILKSNTQ
jgi:hypothetical protein